MILLLNGRQGIGKIVAVFNYSSLDHEAVRGMTSALDGSGWQALRSGSFNSRESALVLIAYEVG
jgi:hypothetical protein